VGQIKGHSSYVTMADIPVRKEIGNCVKILTAYNLKINE